MKRKVIAILTFSLLALGVAPAFAQQGSCSIASGCYWSYNVATRTWSCICDGKKDQVAPTIQTAAVQSEVQTMEVNESAGLRVSLALARASAAEKLAGPLGLPKFGNYQKCYLVGGFCGKLCCDTDPKKGCGCYDLGRSASAQ